MRGSATEGCDLTTPACPVELYADGVAADTGDMPGRAFPFDDDFDFSFRPASYWPDLPTAEVFLSRVRGVARRAAAKRVLDGENLPRLGGEDLYRDAVLLVLNEQLDEGERDSWGGIHPAFMGGECLPPMLPGEVEIARITLDSTTCDVYEVRAVPTATGIHYRVVDEYADQGSTFEVSPDASAVPLSLGELVDLIDTARAAGFGPGPPFDVGLFDMARDFNVAQGGDPVALAGFATVSSAYYPDLQRYYASRTDAWVAGLWLEDIENSEWFARLSDPYRPPPPALPEEDELPPDPYERILTLIEVEALIWAAAECERLGDEAAELMATVALLRGDRAAALRAAMKISADLT